MADGASHLELSIQIDSDPIAGSFSLDAGDPQPFCGWMELVAAIEGARSDDRRAGDEGPDPQPVLGKP